MRRSRKGFQDHVSPGLLHHSSSQLQPVHCVAAFDWLAFFHVAAHAPPGGISSQMGGA